MSIDILAFQIKSAYTFQLIFPWIFMGNFPSFRSVNVCETETRRVRVYVCVSRRYTDRVSVTENERDEAFLGQQATCLYAQKGKI